jgi:hypothetical protein
MGFTLKQFCFFRCIHNTLFFWVVERPHILPITVSRINSNSWSRSLMCHYFSSTIALQCVHSGSKTLSFPPKIWCFSIQCNSIGNNQYLCHESTVGSEDVMPAAALSPIYEGKRGVLVRFLAFLRENAKQSLSLQHQSRPKMDSNLS